MKHLIRAAALLAVAVSADLCDNGSSEYEGNYYCQMVNAITYTNVGGAGSYNKVTNMDSGSGTCSSTPFGYSGSLSPLNEEVSIHVRGPTRLLQFAAYTPGEATVKKARRDEHTRRHAHGAGRSHLRRANEIDKRQVGATVTATIDGVEVTWINEYDGTPATSSAPSSGMPAAPTSAPVAPASSGSLPASPNADSQSSEASAPGYSNSRGWGRQAYYNAQDASAHGLVFLNHYGGNGSGVFDYTFGNSLSYATSDGTSGSASPQTLSDTILPSSAEVVLMTDQECQSGDCGYTRTGTVAYHGFEGAHKAFFFEFEMPNDGSTTADPYDPVNMPALWMLNAQIPRTLQYGNPNCSCWETGCGEFDIFEILTAGYNKAKSTLHGNVAGGSSDWFQRPEDGPIKIGVVLYNDNMHVKLLNNATEFPSTMNSGIISEIVDTTSTQNPEKLVSLYNLNG